MIAVWIIIAILVGSVGNLAVAEQVCSNFCSSLGMVQSNPGKSCNDIYEINKASRGVSSYYWVTTSTGEHQVYCDMELQCGGHKGGWMRVANLDTSTGDACPSDWIDITTPNPSIPVCQADGTGCTPTVFTVNGTNYSKICGKIRGYQKGRPDSFISFGTAAHTSINEPYVDGVSITTGTPRKHVWTYSAGNDDDTDFANNCPCAALSGSQPPPFVQNHFYCESGAQNGSVVGSYYTSDPLWDGDGCIGDNNNCCVDHGMPWFFRQFPTVQNDDLEVRICVSSGDEEILLDQVQLYIQ